MQVHYCFALSILFITPGIGHKDVVDGDLVAPVFHHPHDVCSVVALAPNFPEDTSVFSASYGSMNLFLRSRNRGFGWNNTRAGMLGYKILDCEIAPDCKKSELIFVALAESGLQRSVDGGNIWEPPVVRSSVTQVEAGDLRNGKRFVVCSGGNDVWGSVDGGDSFSRIGTLGEPILSLAIPADSTDHPFVAVGTGSAVVIKDGDGEWVSASVPSAAHTLEFSPDFANDGTIWVGTLGHGLMCSVDRGRSFQPTKGDTPPIINDIVIAPTWPECKDIFLATPKNGVHVSRDGGEVWSRLKLLVAETYQTEDHYQSLAISSHYPEDPTVYCGAYEGLYCTNDAGESWFEMNLNPTRIGRKVAISPAYTEDGTVFMSGYGNPVIVTKDHGETWSVRARGVKMMSPYSLATSPAYASDSLVLLGMGSGIRKSVDWGESWEAIPLEPVSPSAKIGSYETRQIEFSRDFANDQTAFALTAAGFYTSTDAGATWSGQAVPINWTWRLAVSPDWGKTGTAFIGGYSIWRTDDRGASWKHLRKTEKILGLVCADDFEQSGEVFLVSQELGLMRSRDRGATWQSFRDSFQGYSPTKIRMSPDFLQDQTMFVSTVSGGMFKSQDRGDTWTHCAPIGGPVDACFDFVISPNYTVDKTLFGCTYDGLFKSVDDGKTWSLKTDIEFYDDARDPWIFRGDWKAGGHPRSLGYGFHRSKEAGAVACMGFTGSAVELFGMAAPNCGMCEVLIDGESVATVDLYAAKTDPEFMVYQSTDLKQGFHDIVVRVLGTSNPASSDEWVSVDGMTVRYQPDDEYNEVFAKIENLYLTEGASYARDTRGQNQKVAKTRATLRGEKKADGAKAADRLPEPVAPRSQPEPVAPRPQPEPVAPRPQLILWIAIAVLVLMALGNYIRINALAAKVDEVLKTPAKK